MGYDWVLCRFQAKKKEQSDTMSQEKVDKYKQEKVNRKKNLKKEKFRNFMRKCAVAVAGVVLIGWIGYSAYGTYEAKKPKQEAQLDYSALTGLNTALEKVNGTAE